MPPWSSDTSLRNRPPAGPHWFPWETYYPAPLGTCAALQVVIIPTLHNYSRKSWRGKHHCIASQHNTWDKPGVSLGPHLTTTPLFLECQQCQQAQDKLTIFPPCVIPYPILCLNSGLPDPRHSLLVSAAPKILKPQSPKLCLSLKSTLSEGTFRPGKRTLPATHSSTLVPA
jgi:hypothetical protein